MSKKYNCDCCKYTSNNHFNYNQHCLTKKHIEKLKLQVGVSGYCPGTNGCGSPENTQKIIEKNAKIIDDTAINFEHKNEFTCEFCNKTFLYKNHKARHFSRCKDKKQLDEEQTKDEIINKLKIKNKIISKEKELISKEKELISKEKEEIEKEYNDHLKKIANKFIDDKKSPINILFVINNYGSAHNYEDLMGPQLTKAEIEYVEKYGPTAGCERIIYNRCIKDIELDKRPIHCVDPSRDKFALRTENEWVQDWKGEKILTPAFKHMRKAVDISDPDNMDQEDLLKKTKSLIEMDMHGGKKAIKFIGKRTLLECKDKCIK